MTTTVSQPALDGADRTYLRGLGHHLQPVVHIGKAGLTPEVLGALEEALAHHELIKVRFLEHKEEKRALSQHIAQTLHSAFVGIVGHVSLFYRQHPEPEKRHIQLPAPGHRPAVR
jgi:RNA-binding protein